MKNQENRFGFRLLWGLALCFAGTVQAGPFPEAARDLIGRLLPDHAVQFEAEIIPADAGGAVFEIDQTGDRIVLRGSDGVAIASALRWYLAEYAQASISMHGTQIDLPLPLPPVPEKIRFVTSFEHRYCFNYCCFSYSMAWWDWPQWERIIDWMALHGVNMPLAVTGQEAVWQNIGRNLGLTDEEIQAFFVGPAYLPFGWMGCMDGWGGPLGQEWIDRHRDLQQRILERQRRLGMTPVLQGFTGHVPPAIRRIFPEAKLQQLPSWCGFPGTTFVDPGDPLFQRLGRLFVEEQNRLFGTDHFYAADTFIEMSPPSSDPDFLAAMARAVYGGMAEADPDAIWVMQGWLFVNNPQFWRPPQARALLTALPQGQMRVLDLWCESRPAWLETESFYGQPWVWCIIQSFGDQVSLHGGLPQIVNNLNKAIESPKRGDLRGMGFIMEGLGHNPVVDDLMAEMMWRPAQMDLDAWVAAYAKRRYGMDHPKARAAWQGLLATAYRQPGQIASIVTMRPTRPDGAHTDAPRLPYSPHELATAWRDLLECAEGLAHLDTYRYDVAHLTRQVICNLAADAHRALRKAIDEGDRAGLKTAGSRFLQLIDDLDEITGTQSAFLLGPWLEDAKRWATNDAERQRYEWNARNQITLWGPPDGVLHDYAAKQWSGLIHDFYRPRWEQYLSTLDHAMVNEQPFDGAAFTRQLQAWEDAWTRQSTSYPTTPQGDTLTVAKRLWDKHGQAALLEK